MKKQDLMKLSVEDASKKLEELKKELFNLQSSSLAGEDAMKKKARIPGVKKDIARLLTKLNNQ